jgi:hypothetical protein
VSLSNSDVVDVTVSIGEKRVERRIVLNTTGKRISATLFGPRSILLKLKPAEIKVDVVKDNNGTDAPQLTLPEPARSSVEVRDLKLH